MKPVTPYARVTEDNGTPTYGWRADKYRGAWKQIARWEKRYEHTRDVAFLVKDRLMDVRSPGQREAYQQWYNDYLRDIGEQIQEL